MISIEEFENYLQRGEGLRTEFKEATRAFPQSAYETIVSFSNKEGGVIILGVDDDRNIKGVEAASAIQIKEDIIACCNNLNLIQPSVYPSVSEFKHQEKLLIIIKVPVSSQVHKLRGQVFDREV